jgi:hypothetical protein
MTTIQIHEAKRSHFNLHLLEIVPVLARVLGALS